MLKRESELLSIGPPKAAFISCAGHHEASSTHTCGHADVDVLIKEEFWATYH